MKTKHIIKVAASWLATFLLIVLFAIMWCDWKVQSAAMGRLYDEVYSVPRNRVGLLLGTGPVNIYGEPNPYFARRIDGAARLYAAHRIDTVLISGNHTGSYNEPAMMRAQLVKRGVPAAVIIEDGKGYNTFLSIDRARKVYGQRHFTIISQEFHNERAIYMARNAGLDCVGYNCGNYQARRLSVVRMYLRERLSRLKAVLLHAVGKQ